jgi:hypothetical protein
MLRDVEFGVGIIMNQASWIPWDMGIYEERNPWDWDLKMYIYCGGAWYIKISSY